MNILQIFGLTVASVIFSSTTLAPAARRFQLVGVSRYGRS